MFVFGLIVLVHEWGHFITAKLAGMRVDEFAIGFGPKLLKTRRGETTYSLRAIPLGGFNDIAGMDPSDNPAGERGFCEKSVFARMIVILAGAGMNFIMPVIIFFGIYVAVGVDKPDSEPIIGGVIQGRAAANAGLRAGDKIISIDGENVATWQALAEKIQTLDAAKVSIIEYERGDVIAEVSLTPEFEESSKRVWLGVQSQMLHEDKSIPEAFSLAVQRTKDILVFMIGALIDIFKSPTSAELAGPIGIAQMAGQVAETGFIPLLNFAALLSLNLGIINLLPVPALDGGHFVGLVFEAVRGKPLSTKALMYTQRFGIALLLLLMVVATTSDIVRVFFG